MATQQSDDNGSQAPNPTPGAESGDILSATIGRAEVESSDMSSESDESDDFSGPKPLARVRYGLGKELQLFDDAFVVVSHEEATELRLTLANIQRLILAPGDPNPSKLIVMFDLDDGSTIIAAEGMTNVRDFRPLLARLTELRPEIELDPPNMDEQLGQALDIRRRSNIGCYSVAGGAVLLLWVVYLIVAYIGAHTTHLVH